MQKKIVNRGPLLNEYGELNEVGYSNELIKDYEEVNIDNSENKRWRKLTYINIYSFADIITPQFSFVNHDDAFSL